MFQVVHNDLEEYSQKVVLQGNFQDWWQIMEQDKRGEVYPVLVQLENGEVLLLVPWACNLGRQSLQYHLQHVLFLALLGLCQKLPALYDLELIDFMTLFLPLEGEPLERLLQELLG